jgi:hypothetical protein
MKGSDWFLALGICAAGLLLLYVAGNDVSIYDLLPLLPGGAG